MKTIYRTDDGLEFENLAEAEDHEANLLEKEYSKFVDKEYNNLIFSPEDFKKNVHYKVRELIPMRVSSYRQCDISDLMTNIDITNSTVNNFKVLIEAQGYGKSVKYWTFTGE